jgi:hypothetical protein
MAGTAVMEMPALLHQGVAQKPLENIIGAYRAEAVTASVPSPEPSIVEKLWRMAGDYVMGAGIYNAVMELRDDVIVLTSAPFVGDVPLCGIEDGKAVPYF